MRPHGLMFHHFHDRRHPAGQGSMSASQLAEMIHFVGRKRILDAREWMQRALAGTLKGTDLCLTFDDNLRCQYDVAAPVLADLKLTAFFFVYSSVLEGTPERLEIYRHFRTTHFESVDEFYTAFFVTLSCRPVAHEVADALQRFNPRDYLKPFPFYSDGDRRFRFVRDEVLGPARYFEAMDAMIAASGMDAAETARGLWMDEACLGQLHRAGHVIGLHSHTHPTRLEQLDAAGQRREYADNHRHLARILGEAPSAMSHPCNSYNEQTLTILRELGVKLGFRANLAMDGGSELEWPREDHANLLSRMSVAA